MRWTFGFVLAAGFFAGGWAQSATPSKEVMASPTKLLPAPSGGERNQTPQQGGRDKKLSSQKRMHASPFSEHKAGRAAPVSEEERREKEKALEAGNRRMMPASPPEGSGKVKSP